MKLRMLLMTAAALVLAGCSTTSTELVSVALDKDSEGHYNKVLVLAISGDQQVRHTVEQSLADSISRTGASAVVASDYIPDRLDGLSKDEVKAKAEQVVLETGADSVLVASLLSNDVREQYTPPQVNQVPIAVVEPRFGPYVGVQYDTVVMPGYFSSQQEVFVQTSLFDVKTGTAVWRAQSKTINPLSLDRGVEDFSGVMVPRLQSDGMLPDGRR